MSRPYLVTGAAGVVGQSLLAALPAHAAIGLVREGGTRPSHAAGLLTGDVTVPALGLAPGPYRRLAGRIGGVIHSAAITSFTRSAADIHRVNAGGTAHALRLATDAGVPFHLISTIYVERRPGSIPTGRSRAYRESKQAAEELVRAAQVPWSILRMSLVIGHSADGSIPRFQGVYAAMKALVTGEAHVIPVAPGSFIDFLPRDYAAACAVALIEAGAGGEHWITAGKRALTIDQFTAVCTAYARRRGWQVPTPRMVDSEMVHRLIMPAFGDRLGADVRKRLELFTDILGPLTTDRQLPTVEPGLPGPGDPPDLVSCLDASLSHWGSRVRLIPPGAIA
ncbi:SDR family oxidoreductase [Streptomyces orinoci]|uniref:SDR family oxidoreductase n=1 Tax=Streptomyces orinoci TaxID=67339 RepID=A0ABV3JQK9_STRON|nr:SDR family oxidoreductase [Streptomyces orinoci]